MKLLFEGEFNIGVIGHKALTNGIVGKHSKRFFVGASPQLCVTDFRQIDYEDSDGFMRPSKIEVWEDEEGFDIRLIAVCDTDPIQSILIGTMRDGENALAETDWECYLPSPLNEDIISFAMSLPSKISFVE